VEVAVVVVEVMQGAVDEVVDVVPVRHRRVAAAGAVAGGALHRRAGGGMPAVDAEDVLGDACAGGRVEAPVVEIIRVIAMTDGPMTAARPVLVGMVVPFLQGAGPLSAESIDPSPVHGQAGPATP
jgi:hypothetical protein